jgi:hypothetical protein
VKEGNIYETTAVILIHETENERKFPVSFLNPRKPSEMLSIE